MDTRASAGDLNISKILSELRLPIKCYESIYKYILSARKNLSEYENKLKPKVEECYSYLQKRGVRYLVHFTPMENLKSILENGICPRNSIPVKAVCTDPERRDKLLDHGCYSISYPNYPMLYTKQKKLQIPCVVLYIDIKVLQLFHFNNLLFVNKNASSPEFKYNLDSHRGIAYLKNIFQTKPRSKNCPRNGASDIQSEILIKGVIPPEFIRWIYVENEKDRGQVISIGFDPMKVCISKDYYGRENQKNWEIPPYDDKNC